MWVFDDLRVHLIVGGISTPIPWKSFRACRLVGYIIGWVRQPVPIFEPGVYGLVSDMCVAADCRQRGIGRRLFEALKTWFRERDASHVSLQVAVTNPVSQAFWRSVGCEDYMDHLWYTLQGEKR